MLKIFAQILPNFSAFSMRQHPLLPYAGYIYAFQPIPLLAVASATFLGSVEGHKQLIFSGRDQNDCNLFYLTTKNVSGAFRMFLNIFPGLPWLNAARNKSVGTPCFRFTKTRLWNMS